MKKIIVTGSSSGTGQAITAKLLEMNYQVIGIARNHRRSPIKDEGYFEYNIDLGHIAQLESQLKIIKKNHPIIDGIICNAGYGKFTELEQFSVADIQAMFNVNVLSHIILVKMFLPEMKRQNQGKIIFIGSECALEGQKKSSIYSATKFALRGFCQSVRKECATSNIGVTIINPGLVDTPFFTHLQFKPGLAPQNSILPHQIAATVAFVLESENNIVVEELNIQPMKNAVVKKPAAD